MANQKRKRTKTERMGIMSRNIVRPPGQCTECGITATHANECVTCHVVTLSVSVIKNIFAPHQIRSVTENLADTDLIADSKDNTAPSSVRRIASTITRLAFANGLNVRDVQRRIITRLRETCEAIERETPESRADYIARISEWIGTLIQKIKK